MNKAADKRNQFAQAIEAGHSAKQAAILAGYSGRTAATAGCRLLKHPSVQAARQRIRSERTEPAYDDPLQFLMAVATDQTRASRLRVRAAIALLPYLHRRPISKC